MSTEQELQRALIEASVEQGVEILKGLFASGKGKVLSELQTRDAVTNYLQSYNGRHGQVKVLGMSSPIPLSQIYTAAQVMRPDHLRAFADVASLQESFRETGRRFQGRDGERTAGLTLANRTQFLCVLGQPGAGKSTFLKRIGWEALQPKKPLLLRHLPNLRSDLGRSYEHDCFPVFIELKSFRWEKVDLLAIIKKEFTCCGFPEGFAKAALDNGKLLILLDGLDEVPSEQVDEVVAHIRDFCDEHERNRVIASCRTAFYKGAFPRFTDVLISDFDDAQIEAFINNWFSSSEDMRAGVAPAFWELLKKPEHASVLELARTPLLITFLCLNYDNSQSLPANRSDLYEEALRILIEKWNAEKRVKREGIYQGFTTKMELLLLGELAGPAFANDVIFFRRKEVADVIARFFEREINAPRSLNSEQVLEAIEVQQGILVQRAHDCYSFSHLTLQEFLAASHFKETGRTNQVVCDCFFERRWREVFLLMAGMTQADTLLRQMSTVLEKGLRGQSRLQAWLEWANCFGELQGDAERLRCVLLKVVVALCFSQESDWFPSSFINALTYACSIGRDVGLSSDHDVSPVLLLVRDLGHEDDDAKARARAFLVSPGFMSSNLKAGLAVLERAKKEKRKTWRRELLGSLGLATEFQGLTMDELKAFESYLYGVRLILDCKKAALSVTKGGWEHVEKRLFAIPEQASESTKTEG